MSVTASQIQYAAGVFFFIVGVGVIFSNQLTQFLPIIEPAINVLKSDTFIAGITILGLGLAYISIANIR
jgi:hypothetical protein